MYRMLPATLRKAVRGRRKDDATFAVIGAVLALFFLIEFGWVITR